MANNDKVGAVHLKDYEIAANDDGQARRSELEGRGGPPHGGDMNERLTRLETEFEHVRKDLDEIKADQKETNQTLREVKDSLGALPTKSDLSNWKLQWVAIGITAIILVVSLTFGGLSLLLSAIEGSNTAP